MTPTNISAELCVASRCRHGEGPAWSDTEQALYWVDIELGEVHRFHPASAVHEKRFLPPPVTLIIPGVPHRVTTGRSLCELDFGRGTTTNIAELQTTAPVRFNDGKLDPTGRLWVGTMALDEKTPAGSLYRLSAERFLVPVVEKVTVSNGLAWHEDRMYFIDSGKKCVDAFTFNSETGEIDLSTRQTVISVAGGNTPDGMSVDSSGNLWIAILEGGCVTCFDPHSGKALCNVWVDAAKVTSCCFGGTTLEQLYITTAREPEEKSQAEESGSLFVATPGVKGVRYRPPRY